MASFSINHPGIKLTLDYSDVRQDMIDGGYDIAIRMGARAKSSSVSRRLFEVPRRLVASKTYLKKHSKVTTPEDLQDWDWIELSPVRHIKPTFRKSTSKTKQITIKPTAQIATNDALALYRLARSGAGLAVVPEFLAEEGVRAGVVKYVLPEWKLDPIEVFATWPSNAPKNGLIKLFIGEIGPAQSLN
jgi:DNA-binding transcriptional LysR family regulator